MGYDKDLVCNELIAAAARWFHDDYAGVIAAIKEADDAAEVIKKASVVDPKELDVPVSF